MRVTYCSACVHAPPPRSTASPSVKLQPVHDDELTQCPVLQRSASAETSGSRILPDSRQVVSCDLKQLGEVVPEKRNRDRDAAAFAQLTKPL
jgi:hypothetical protein